MPRTSLRTFRTVMIGAISAAAALLPVEKAAAYSPYLVVPAPSVAEASAAYRYANMSDVEALAELDKRKVPYKKAAPIPGVIAPIRLTGRLHGVWIHSSIPESQRETSIYEVLDARLALALDDFTKILERHDIEEVVHYSLYRPNVPRHDHDMKVAPAVAKPAPPAATPAMVAAKPVIVAAKPAMVASSSAKPATASATPAAKPAPPAAKPAVPGARPSLPAPLAKPLPSLPAKGAPAPAHAKQKESPVVKKPAPPPLSAKAASPARPAPSAPAKPAPSAPAKAVAPAKAASPAKPAPTPPAAKPAPAKPAPVAKPAPANPALAAKPAPANPAPAARPAPIAARPASKPLAPRASLTTPGATPRRAANTAPAPSPAPAVKPIAPKPAATTAPAAPVVRQTWAPPGTRHPAGLAIDVAMLKKRDGQWISVATHFRGTIGAKTCGDGVRAADTPEARELRSIVCESNDLGVFTYVLTPNYNAAHFDHFHMEIRPQVKWFLYQ